MGFGGGAGMVGGGMVLVGALRGCCIMWIMVVGDGIDGGGSGHSAQMGDMTHDSYIMGGVVVIVGIGIVV